MAPFPITARLTQASQLINQLPSVRLPPLFSRFLRNLHLRDERAFTTEEEVRDAQGMSV
jgi:hypothetical protein